MSPLVPGHLSASGTVCLPLHMDGRMTDTGITPVDRNALSRIVEAHSDSFVGLRPNLLLSPTEDHYRSRVCPSWLTEIWNLIQARVSSYETQPDHSRRVVALLKDSLARFQPLMSGLLYSGLSDQPPGHFILFAQDLTLYAQPVKLTEDDPYPLLQFLGTLFHVESLMSHGLTDQIVVQEDEDMEDIRRTTDFSDLVFPENIDFHDRYGNSLRFERCEIRPVCVYPADALGNIDINENVVPMVHPAFRHYQAALLQETNILLGYFLFAFNQMGQADLDLLRNQVIAFSGAFSRKSAVEGASGFVQNVITAALDSLFTTQ